MMDDVPEFLRARVVDEQRALIETVHTGTRIGSGLGTSEPSRFYAGLWDHIRSTDLHDIVIRQALFMAPHALVVGDEIAAAQTATDDTDDDPEGLVERATTAVASQLDDAARLRHLRDHVESLQAAASGSSRRSWDRRPTASCRQPRPRACSPRSCGPQPRDRGHPVVAAGALPRRRHPGIRTRRRHAGGRPVRVRRHATGRRRPGELRCLQRCGWRHRRSRPRSSRYDPAALRQRTEPVDRRVRVRSERLRPPPARATRAPGPRVARRRRQRPVGPATRHVVVRVGRRAANRAPRGRTHRQQPRPHERARPADRHRWDLRADRSTAARHRMARPPVHRDARSCDARPHRRRCRGGLAHRARGYAPCPRRVRRRDVRDG